MVRKLSNAELRHGYTGFVGHTGAKPQGSYVVCHSSLQDDAVWVMAYHGIPLDNLYLRDDCHPATLWFMPHPPAHNFPYNLTKLNLTIYRNGPPKPLKG